MTVDRNDSTLTLLERLTPIEWEILSLRCQSKSIDEIANLLHMSRGTVSRRMGLIYQKMDITYPRSGLRDICQLISQISGKYAQLLDDSNQYRYSCFISHASIDSEFADILRADLLRNNVICWHYRYDMQGGRFWRTQINEAIKVHDKLVLICSKVSLQRRNVVDELIAAMERERETGSQKLFPVRLDDFILSDEMLSLADEKMNSGEWREDWARYVRAYHIPDFSKWKRHDAYRAEFRNLLEALKNPARR